MTERRLGAAGLFPLAVLFGLNAVDELDRRAFDLLLPEIRRAFGLSLATTSAFGAAVLPAGLVFGLPVAWVADRRRRVPIAVAGAAAWGLASLGTGLAPSVLLLALARIGSGLGRAVNEPVHASLLADYYAPALRARVFGVHRAANTVGAFVAPLAAGLLADRFGWRAPFYVFALPTAALLGLALLLREPPRLRTPLLPPSLTVAQGFGVLWGVRTIRRLWLAFPFLASGSIGLSFLVSLYYAEVFGVGVRQRGFIQSFDAPFVVLGIALGTPLLDRALARDPARLMRDIGRVASLIGILVVGLAAAPTLWAGVACAWTMAALAAVLLAGGSAIVSLVAPPEVRASAFAYFGLFALVGVGALPVAGLVGEALGLRWGIGVLAPVVLAGSLVLRTAARFVAADMAAAGSGAAPTPPER